MYAVCEHCVRGTHRQRTPQERLRKIAAQADAFSPEQLGQQLKEMGIKATATGNDLSDPFPFNLMFATHIGPSGDKPGPRRPPVPVWLLQHCVAKCLLLSLSVPLPPRPRHNRLPAP